jgi:hypothetical protein
MTDSTSEAPIDERPAEALRLLFRAEIAWMCWRLYSEHFKRFSFSFMRDLDWRLPGGMEAALGLPVLSAVLALGFVRLVSPLGDVWARRWGYAAALVLGVKAAWHLCLGVLVLQGVDPRPQGISIFLVSGLASAGSTTVMLAAVWRVGQVLTAGPPAGVLRFAAGAVALQWVLYPVVYTRLSSLDSEGSRFQGMTGYSAVLLVLSILLPILIAGALALTRAALLRTRAPSSTGADWTSARDGLGLYSTSLVARIALIILTAALPPLLSKFGVDRAAGKQVQGFVLLAAPVLSGMMLVGLMRLACVPGLEGARGYVYASLTLLMISEQMVVAALYDKQWIPSVVLPATSVLLTGSFHRLARALNDQEAAQTARQVAFLLFVPASVSGVFRFFAPERGLTHLLTIVAVLCVLVGVVRFFFLLSGLRQRMAEAAAPPSQVSIFPSA